MNLLNHSIKSLQWYDRLLVGAWSCCFAINCSMSKKGYGLISEFSL